jgi:aminoglycoside phosphotransferase (APT) family kinase protein
MSVENALTRGLGKPARVLTWERSVFCTSHPLDELNVAVGDDVLALTFKDLDPEALIPQSRGTKPAFVTDARREPLTYANILTRGELGTPQLYAMDLEQGWMVIERIAGVELWQVGDPAVWQRAAGWLARLHDAIDVTDGFDGVPLVRFDAALMEVWLDRARHSHGAALRQIVDAFDDVVAVLMAMPQTFLHGEAYPSNIFVRRDGRVCGIDWEMAGVGPCGLDVAALVTGWVPEVRARMIDTYQQSVMSTAVPDRIMLDAGVRAASIVHCVQWLGWAEGWTPPEDHARDWLADAHHHLSELRRCR